MNNNNEKDPKVEEDFSDEEDYYSDEDDDFIRVDPNKEHPLEREWAVYYDSELLVAKARGQPQWGDQISRLFVFNTVENFWRMNNNLPLSSALPASTSYYLFDKKVGPTWEHHPDGGKLFWGIDEIDIKCCLLIGEQFQDTGLTGIICQNQALATNAKQPMRNKGAVPKTGYRFSFWTNNKDEERILALGKRIKKHINEDILSQLHPAQALRLKDKKAKDSESGWDLVFNAFYAPTPKGKKLTLFI